MRAKQPLLLTAILTLSFLLGCFRNELNRARQQELSGNDAAALELYKKVLNRTSERDEHKRSELLVRVGECLFRMQRFPEAFAAFQKAGEADRNNTTAHLRMGEMFLTAGVADRAREEAQIVLNSRNLNDEALALLGAAWAASDNDQLAAKAYERVLQLDPKRVTTAVALADIYSRQNQVSKARETLLKATKVQPGSSLPWLALARLAEQEGEADEAEKAYRRAVAIEDTPDTNFRLAQFLQRAARIAEAEQVLRTVDAQTRSHPVALADFELLSGHPEQAIEHYRSALKSTAVDQKRQSWFGGSRATPVANENYSIIAARLIEAEIAGLEEKQGSEREKEIAAIHGKLDGYRPQLDSATTAILETELALAGDNILIAKEFATEAVDLAPSSAPAHYVMGLVALASGNDDAARKAWQEALDNDSHFEPAHLMLARDALARGDADQADEHARDVVRENPGDVQGVLLLARALLAEGKPSMAIPMAQRAELLDPTSEEPCLILGNIALQTNNIAQALLYFERAVIESPNSEEAMEGLLRIYRRGSISYASLKKMEQKAGELPLSATLFEINGRLYADHGWYTDAIRCLSRAVKVDPKRGTAARLLAQLQLATGDLSQATTAASSLGGNSEAVLKAYQAQSAGNWKQAVGQYEKAVLSGDPTGVAANNLAWLYAEQGARLDRALELASSAATSFPDNPAVLDTLGFVHLRRCEYSEAVRVLETAARLTAAKPGNRETARQIRKHLSDAYLRNGQTDQALEIAQNRGPFAVK